MEWSRFISFVPKEYQTNGDSVMRYYAERIRSTDENVARKYANEWTLWESALLSVDYSPERTESEVFEEKDTMAIAKLETHYFLNKCFIPENYILENIKKIKHISCSLVHGRFDMCTPAVSAVDLATAYGDKLTLTWVNSGHLRTDPEMLVAIKKVADIFLA